MGGPKAPVNPSLLLNPRRYGDGAKDLWTTLNTIQENITKGGQRDRSRLRPDGSRMPKSRAIKGIDEDLRLNKGDIVKCCVSETGASLLK